MNEASSLLRKIGVNFETQFLGGPSLLGAFFYYFLIEKGYYDKF